MFVCLPFIVLFYFLSLLSVVGGIKCTNKDINNNITILMTQLWSHGKSVSRPPNQPHYPKTTVMKIETKLIE